MASGDEVRFAPIDTRRIIFSAKAIRTFGDGLMSVALAVYADAIGLTGLQFGLIASAALVGTSVMTWLVGRYSDQIGRRRTLLAGAALMVVTGIAYASSEAVPVLIVVAFLGTVNPTSGDVSSFLPVEQAVLAQTGDPIRRVDVFAWFSVVGSMAGAFGALSSALGPAIDATTVLGEAGATRVLFLGYGALGLATIAVVARLGPDAELPAGSSGGRLGPSRGRVGGLSALFALDAFAGGLVVQSVIALFFLREFDMDPAIIGGVFFGTSLLAALSFLASARLATRFGLVNTMVFTHLPSNALLLGVALSPVAWLAVAFLFARSMLSQMDVPPRQALVVSVVEPGERAAAAAATGLARSLGATPAPILGGAMLGAYAGLPFLACAALKSTYDVLLLAFFGRVQPRS